MVTNKNKSGILRSLKRITLIGLIIKEKPFLVSLRVFEKQSQVTYKHKIASSWHLVSICAFGATQPRMPLLAIALSFYCKYMNRLLLPFENDRTQGFHLNVICQTLAG